MKESKRGRELFDLFTYFFHYLYSRFFQIVPKRVRNNREYITLKIDLFQVPDYHFRGVDYMVLQSRSLFFIGSASTISTFYLNKNKVLTGLISNPPSNRAFSLKYSTSRMPLFVTRYIFLPNLLSFAKDSVAPWMELVKFHMTPGEYKSQIDSLRNFTFV